MPEPTITVTVRMPPELYAWLKKQGNMTQTIVQILEERKRRS